MAAGRSVCWGHVPRALCVAAVFCGGLAHSATQATEPGAKPADTSPRLELRVQQLRPGLNVIFGAGGNVTVWSGADGVVLVDSGLASATNELMNAVARVAPGPLRFVVNTHGHADHTGANEAAARKGAVIVGHESLREPVDFAADPGGRESGTTSGAARPVVTTADSLALHLNGDRLGVYHVAEAHTASDLVVRWSDADVVCLGDIYWSGQYPFIDVDAGGSLAGMVAAVEAALARSTARTIVVPGHGAVSNRAELAAYRDMLVAIGRKVREAIEQGQGVEEILAARPTAEFDARFARPGATVTPDEFVRAVFTDLSRPRASR